jgi:F-type H+-transporting ATPase subunit a
MINHFRMDLTQVLTGRGAGTRLKLKALWGLLLFTALFVGLGADLMLAVSTESEAASAIPPKAAEQGGGSTATPEQEEHGLSQKAVEIGRLFGFPITNSMVVSWIVAVGLIIFAQAATRNMKRVPEGAQNFLGMAC